MFHLWFCLILLDVKINLYQCQCQFTYRNNSNSTRTKLTVQLTPAAINEIVSGRSIVAPKYTVFDVFHTV